MEEPPQVDPVQEAANLPLSERVTHKHWKVREAAYRELADKFKVSPDDSKIYADFLPSLGKIARDANAPAQLAGFDALSAYADTASIPQVRRVATDIVKGIVQKGLSGRPTNKTKAVDTILMIIGNDAGDLAVEAVVTNGFKHRTPKIIVACVDCLTAAVDAYGTKPVPVKPIASKLGPLLDHSQEAVRSAAKALVVMLHRWIGPAVKPVLKDAKEVIVKEMEKAFTENAKEGKPKPKKLTRSMEQRARRTGAALDDAHEDDGFGEAAEEEEEVDLAEEINLLEKLNKVQIEVEEGVNKGWYTAVDSKKWNVRKKALDTAVETIGEARLTPGLHHEVFSRIRKILTKDANVNVVASSAKLIKAMAYGLKKTFPPNTAKTLTTDLFGRLKEKNRIVVGAVCAALDALHEKRCIRVVDLLDEITAAAGHKVPKARCEVFLWLGRCLLSGTAGSDLKGAPLKCFGSLCLKASDDSAPEVRDAGLEGLAVLQKVVGERNVALYLEKLDKKRKEKVSAMKEALPEPARVARAPEKSQKDVKTRSQPGKAKAKPNAKAVEENRRASPAQKRPKRPPKPAEPMGSDDEGESSHGPSDALQAAVERFPGFEAENWSVKSFKTRAAAVGVISTVLVEKESFNDEDVSIILGLLQCEPGLSDSNFVAVKPKLQLFGMVAEKCSSPPPRKTLRPLLINALEKLGDIKSAKMTAAILTTHAEATSPRYFFEIIHQCSRETKNSRALIGMLKFAASLVEDFRIPEKSELVLAALTLDHMTNPAPAAKNAAVALACKAATRIGTEKFRELLKQNDVQDAVLEAFEAELVKYSKEPDPPTKQKRFNAPAATPAEASEEQNEISSSSPQSTVILPEPETKAEKDNDVTEAQAPNDSIASVVPERVSIAREFAPGVRVLLELKSSNWKKRQEALEFVNDVLTHAHDCIEPNVGPDIIAALRARLGDSNRNLATLAYTVVNRLMQAMGPSGNVHLKVMAPGVFGQGCIDIKKNVRDAAMKCLEGWFQMYGLSPLIPYVHLPFSSHNSNIRREFLEWLVPRLQGELGHFDASREDLSVLVDPSLSCLRDRTVEVRHFADLLLEQVIRSVGVSVIEGKVSLLSKTLQLQLDQVLDKYRASTKTVGTNEVQPAVKGSSTQTPRSARKRPQSVVIPRTPIHRRAVGAGEESTPVTGSRRPRPASVRVTPVSSTGRYQNTPFREASPLLKPNNGRDVRAQRFANKRLYFQEELSGSNHAETPPLMREELQDLAGDLSECCSTELYAKLMAPPNRFRMHVEAIDMVRSQLEDHPDSLGSVADVLLRWAACRIEDSKTPPTVLVKLATFVSNMSEILISSEVKLGEYEASAIMPPVIEKTGSTRQTVREAMCIALMSICDIVDDEVLLILFTSCLRQPFNARALSEISREICRLLDKRCVAGAGITPGVLSSIGRVAGGADETAGKAAAECLEKAYSFFGDDLWNLIGELNGEEAAFLDERLTSAINGVRHNTHPSKQVVNSKSAAQDHPDRRGIPGPGDIRNEDFRLSVAPAPPSGVLTSISDSLNMATPTPIKTRSLFNGSDVPETPALPNRIYGVRSEMDAMEDAANDVLLRLRSPDRDMQLSGLASIFEDLKREAYLLRSSAGGAILQQLVRCFGNTLARLEEQSALDDDPAVLKSFLKGVIRFAREPELLRRLDQEAVEILLGDALNAMIPQTVERVEDWDQVRRGVNLMIVKILESCDQNLLFTALINLLLKNIRLILRTGDERVSALAKSSICIKSIAKVAKRGYRTCRIDALLRDIHLFLVANPVRRDGAASAEDQTFAMRLLKTVVNSVIDEIGEDIRSRLSLIPHPDKSQLIHYVEMTLTGRDRDVQQREEVELSSPDHVPNDIQARGNVRVHEALSRIDPLTKSEEELQKLRAVLLSYPEVDINSHLLSCTQEVREYVTAGLARFREEANSIYGQESEEGRNEGTIPMEERHHADDLSLTNPGSGTAGQVYLKRLHEIQLRYGLQSHSKTNLDNFPSPVVLEKENGTVEKPDTSGEDARGKASSLRERMARIRELQAAAKQ